MPQKPFKRNYRLVQHTPMIHFQHDQKGATLRASDVKPKIDRYIWEHLTARHAEWAEAYQPFLSEKYFSKAGSQKKSSSGYKIHITAIPQAHYIPTAYIKNQDKGPVIRQVEDMFGLSRIEVIGNTPYFANVEKISKEIWGEIRLAVSYKNVALSVFSPEPKVTELIGKVLPYVLANHGFGTRSSKGFGTFLVPGTERQVLQRLTPYRFSVRVNENNETLAYERLFQRIDMLYKSLRSGINQSFRRDGLYFKSLIFKYFYERGIQWDKKSIKQHFYSRDLNNQQTKHGGGDASPLHFSSTQKYLVRDLLGLATHQDWLKPYGDRITKKSSPNDKAIERFASPIWFRPVRRPDRKFFDVYVGCTRVPPGMRNQTFELTNQNRTNGPLSLSTPPAFDVEDFLRFAFEEVELEEHVEGRFQNDRDYEDLSSMYQDIRNNL
ncbi:MAG: hypothetical protein AAFR61_29010 [Bacteroidota bacterium]